MVVGGIVLMPIDLAMKGYLAMGVVMLIQSCITLTKTIRDNDEAAQAREPDRRRQDRAPADGRRQRTILTVIVTPANAGVQGHTQNLSPAGIPAPRE